MTDILEQLQELEDFLRGNTRESAYPITYQLLTIYRATQEIARLRSAEPSSENQP